MYEQFLCHIAEFAFLSQCFAWHSEIFSNANYFSILKGADCGFFYFISFYDNLGDYDKMKGSTESILVDINSSHD